MARRTGVRTLSLFGHPHLSDFPLLIGEMLRRGELRAQRQARRRSLIQKFRATFAITSENCELKGSFDPPHLKIATNSFCSGASADPRQKEEPTFQAKIC